MQITTEAAPRGGAGRALLDRLLGPGATPAEVTLALGTAGVFALAVPLVAGARGAEWSTAQTVAAVLLAFDLGGGVVVNASPAARRLYHAPGRTVRDHLVFVSGHLLHVGVVAWLFHDAGWRFGAAVGAALLVAAAVVLRTPLHLRRPAAIAICAAVVFAATSATGPGPGMEWFVPLLFLKLLVSYLLGNVPPGNADA